MIELVLVKVEMFKHGYDVRTVRGLGWVISDHSIVQCEFNLACTGRNVDIK